MGNTPANATTTDDERPHAEESVGDDAVYFAYDGMPMLVEPSHDDHGEPVRAPDELLDGPPVSSTPFDVFDAGLVDYSLRYLSTVDLAFLYMVCRRFVHIIYAYNRRRGHVARVTLSFPFHHMAPSISRMDWATATFGVLPDPSCAHVAAAAGSVAALDWLADRGVMGDNQTLLGAAAHHGHVAVLGWAANRDPDCVPGDSWDMIWRPAARAGQIDVLEWALAECKKREEEEEEGEGEEEGDTPVFDRMLPLCIGDAHVNTLAWMHARGARPSYQSGTVADQCSRVLIDGADFQALEFMRTIWEWPIDSTLVNGSDNVYTIAAGWARMHPAKSMALLQWALRIGVPIGGAVYDVVDKLWIDGLDAIRDSGNQLPDDLADYCAKNYLYNMLAHIIDRDWTPSVETCRIIAAEDDIPVLAMLHAAGWPVSDCSVFPSAGLHCRAWLRRRGLGPGDGDGSSSPPPPAPGGVHGPRTRGMKPRRFAHRRIPFQ